MLNLEAFATNLARLINSSHFRADCKVEENKYYLKLSVNDKDYNLYRLGLSDYELDIFAVKENEFLGVTEELLTSVKLKDIFEVKKGIFEYDTIVTDSANYNEVMAYIIKSIMIHYTFSKAGKFISLPFSTPSSFSFKPEEVSSEILTSAANTILRNVAHSTLRDSVLSNSFWIDMGKDGVIIHQVVDDVVVLVFNIGCDGSTGSTCYNYVYHDVCSAKDIISLGEMVVRVCNICC